MRAFRQEELKAFLMMGRYYHPRSHFQLISYTILFPDSRHREWKFPPVLNESYNYIKIINPKSNILRNQILYPKQKQDLIHYPLAISNPQSRRQKVNNP